MGAKKEKGFGGIKKNEIEYKVKLMCYNRKTFRYALDGSRMAR